MSTLKVSTIQDTSGNNSSTPAGIASGTAKAWVNFNGTGTVAIGASYNVSSITDNATGDYTLNFTTAMVDANYSFNGYVTAGVYSSKTANAVRIISLYNSVTVYDSSEVNVAIFR